MTGSGTRPLCLILCLASFFATFVQAQQESTDLPVVLPYRVPGVRECRLSMNGTWEFLPVPSHDFWKDSSSAGWKPIRVPGEPMMQGFAIAHDIEYGYRTLVAVPRDFAGKRVIVRFNGVYSDARVWVNGMFVRGHRGGFTSWDCDITELAVPGTRVRLVVGIQDRTDEISFGSGYAKHPIGGILRSVELIALPAECLRELYATVEFDSLYRNAMLSVYAGLGGGAEGMLDLSLSDPDGKKVMLPKSRISFTKGMPTASLRVPVERPLKWNAEQPRLYRLRARLLRDGIVTEEAVRRIGFREVRVQGEKLLVNGQPVKLRGACRHDIHPTQGRSTTPGQDREDAALAKEANINFIRTSHYPPAQEFLDACDEYGLYVEEETAICFVGPNRYAPYKKDGESQSDTAYTGRYLSQLQEMLARDRHHASVIIWSIGNENAYGSNFQAEYAYVRSADRTRPVMFSYPGYVPKDRACYDIASIHYVSYDGHASQLGIEIRDFGTPGIPVIHDEWAHVPCYNTPTLRTDPNVRNFWGESIKKMWDGCFASGGGTGGAIWGFIDEYFMLPDTVVGYGAWGIVDVWRRKKPEFWLTRKAYSPVRVERTRFDSLAPGEDLRLPVQNRFDHTNLREVEIRLSAGNLTSTMAGPDVSPHGRGYVIIPGGFLAGGAVSLKFVEAGGRVVEEERVTVGVTPAVKDLPPHPLRITEEETRIVAEGGAFRYIFDRRTGLLADASVGGRHAILSGPWLHLTRGGGKIDWSVDSLVDVTGSAWKADSTTFVQGPGELSVSVRGHADTTEVRFTTVVGGNGEIRTSFDVPRVPERWHEVGVRYVLDPELARLSWTREALWSLYPGDHIGRPAGTAQKTVAAEQQDIYRERPGHSWSKDTRDLFLDGKPGSRGTLRIPVDFRSTKEKIYSYALVDSLSGRGVRVISKGEEAARAVVNSDGTTSLIILSRWNYANLSWGNYDRVSRIENPCHGNIHMQLIDGEPPR